MIEQNPYTYLIGWTKLNKYYYGVRYAIGCRPEDLWTTYFTSSKRVADMRRRHGEPDVIEVRRIFSDVDAAILWEHRVLTRLDVINNEMWLNQHALPANRNACRQKTYRKKKSRIIQHVEPAQIPIVQRDPNWIPHYMINSYLG